MGLKITKQIGTDQGITKTAYIRISSYNIQKNGQAYFNTELFMTKPVDIGVGYMGTCNNQEIGQSFSVALTKIIQKTRTIQVPSQQEVEVSEIITTPPLVEGDTPTTSVVTHTEMRPIMVDSIETYDVTVPDLSILETTPIFIFAYSKLKEKLQVIFGDVYVIDA